MSFHNEGVPHYEAHCSTSALLFRTGLLHFLKRHVQPEYARRLKAEKAEGSPGWKTQAWKQALFVSLCGDMCITIERTKAICPLPYAYCAPTVPPQSPKV